jgi:hypothetical protein
MIPLYISGPRSCVGRHQTLGVASLRGQVDSDQSVTTTRLSRESIIAIPTAIAIVTVVVGRKRTASSVTKAVPDRSESGDSQRNVDERFYKTFSQLAATGLGHPPTPGEHFLVSITCLRCYLGPYPLLYATVGQVGGTSFLALMAFASFSPNQMRPTALMLNVVGASYSTWLFNRGHSSHSWFRPYLRLLSVA